MTDEAKERMEKLRAYMMELLNQTDLLEEEKEDCVKSCPGYLWKVVWKHLERDKIKDCPKHLHTAILGFIGGYCARHLYEYHREQQGNN